MQFERLFWVNSSFLIVQAVAAVIFAFFGVGAWALIWGQLVGQTVSCVIVWATTTWRPNLVWNWEIARTQIRFSLWIMLSSFQTWLFLYADNAIAGMFLGVTGLGVYSLGFNISIIIPTFMVAALSDVAYPAFCKLDGDAAKVGKSLIGLQRLTSAILFPIAFGIASIASPAVALLYGDKWEGLGMVIGLLGIMPGLSSIWNLNESAYLSIGKPDIHTKLSALSLLILLPTLWAAAPYGLFVFTAARFAGAFILPLAHIIVGTRSLELKIFEQLKRLFLPLVAALVMFAAVYFAVTQLQPFSGWMGWIKLLLAIILGAFIYALTLFLFGRELLNDLFGGVKRVLARGNA
jgi:O-antigen/teichoic acid export membrane protein